MKPQDVEEIVHKTPFQPFRIVLNDGEEITVRRPRKSHVSGIQIALVGECRRKGGPVVERFRLINTDNVQTAEFLDLPIDAR